MIKEKHFLSQFSESRDFGGKLLPYANAEGRQESLTRYVVTKVSDESVVRKQIWIYISLIRIALLVHSNTLGKWTAKPQGFRPLTIAPNIYPKIKNLKKNSPVDV